MATTPDARSSPRKRLPVNPSIEHLKKQAKRLATANSSMQLADAQHQLAREYGAKNWADLARIVESMSKGATRLEGRGDLPPLAEASNRNDIESVRRILATEDFTQHDLDLALARAVLNFRQRKAIAELLVEHGADPDGQYGANYGPIVLITGECLDPDGLQFLLDRGTDVTFAPLETKYGPASPMIGVLSTYARGKNAEKHRMIEMLLARGASVPPQVTPVFVSIHRGDVEALRKFIEADPSVVNRRFPDMPYGNTSLKGATLLHLAVDFGELECIDLLLEKGAQINAMADVINGAGGQTPIFHAIASPVPGGHTRTLEHLINCGRWIDRDLRAPIVRWDKKDPKPVTFLELAELVIEDKNHPELRLLRKLNRPRIDDPIFVRSVDAIDAGNLDELIKLLREHPNLVTMHAEESGSFAGPYFRHPKLLWFVAENPTRTGKLPANICAIAAAIIDAGASVEDMNYTLNLVGSSLVARQTKMQTPLLETLVQRGADSGAALSAAIQHEETEAIETLLRLGANPDLPSAAGIGDLDALRAGLAKNPTTEQKLQALYNAASRGKSDAIELLVQHGVEVNSRIGLGTTALHLAALNGHSQCVERLLALGADRALQDGRYNGTPSDWAAHGGHQELSRMLKP